MSRHVDEVFVLDAADGAFRSLLDGLPRSESECSWVEDELHPYTEADRLRDTRYCWLLDHEGRAVADLWLEQGCPEQFGWTEILAGPPS